jgi:hypothetical protein
MSKFNKVFFETEKVGSQLQAAKFTITDFSVTSGESHDIAVGNEHNITHNGDYFGFYCDRKGSENVASWFSGRISASENTFNHEPGDLNFAILGTFKIQFVKTPDKKYDGIWWIFENVMLAQGHSGSTNNWWFGGKGFKHNGDWRVDATGKSEDGRFKCSATFIRGGDDNQDGTAVDQVRVVGIQFP